MKLRIELLKLSQSGTVPQLGGLENGNVVALGTHLYRRGLELVLVPSHRLIGLTEHPAHLMSRRHQGFQGGNGKVGGAHKDDSHSISSWACSSISSSSSSLL